LTLLEEGKTRRVRQDAMRPTQESHLAFPHAKHLDPAGVKSPARGRIQLKCAACHRADASARGFEPISMAKHCQECHALQFEPAVTEREVPHGKPALAITTIEEFYSNLALKGVPDSFQKAFGIPGEGLERRTGEATPEQRRAAYELAARKSRQVAADLFEKRVCKTCHEVSAGPEWRIAPVLVNSHWMPHARFDHKVHAQAGCTSCHDVERSKLSSDVAMPTIAKCRECHGGPRPAMEKVMSNCLLCHGFHDPTQPWDPTFRPKANTRVAEGR
jgi:predicted CXXCH cytochrome family protein